MSFVPKHVYSLYSDIYSFLSPIHTREQADKVINDFIILPSPTGYSNASNLIFSEEVVLDFDALGRYSTGLEQHPEG